MLFRSLPHQGGGASYEMRVRVREGVDGAESYAHTWLLHEAEGRAGDPPGAPPLRFEPIGIDVPLPAREGAYDIVMEVTERGGLRWTRPLATRVVQVVAVVMSEVPQDPSKRIQNATARLAVAEVRTMSLRRSRRVRMASSSSAGKAVTSPSARGPCRFLVTRAERMGPSVTETSRTMLPSSSCSTTTATTLTCLTDQPLASTPACSPGSSAAREP